MNLIIFVHLLWTAIAADLFAVVILIMAEIAGVNDRLMAEQMEYAKELGHSPEFQFDRMKRYSQEISPETTTAKTASRNTVEARGGSSHQRSIARRAAARVGEM